jgi:ActD protein
MYLIAEFREQSCLQKAIHALKAQGYDPADLDVFSEEPVEFPRGLLDRPSHMSLAAVLGAIALGGSATTGVFLAQHNYELVTGGMPLFSFWGTGVISYETTMLGAVLATFGWFLWESGLVKKRDRTVPIPLVPPESMCLRVLCRDLEQVRQGEHVVSQAGAVSIETLDGITQQASAGSTR